MLYDNFAMLTKRELLIRIVKLLKKDELITGLKYLPVEMRPRNKRPVRCCIHKDRYILKHKIISILGFEITDEEIDLITEGILTLSKVERLLTQGVPEKSQGPANDLVNLIQNSDKITFIVGTRINVAHQDPNLPVELEIRRNVVKKIKYLLETKFLKYVEITYL